MTPAPTLRHRLARVALGLAAIPAPLVARAKCRLPASTGDGGPIYVLGDSHASFFSGRDEMIAPWPRSTVNRADGFRVFRLGPALAYRLPDLGTTSLGREKLLTTLAFGPVRPRGTVLLCFGEIDCRFHLLREAEVQARDLDDVVAECARRYATVIREVQRMGFRAAAWGVIPPNDAGSGALDSDCPAWGSTEQRLAVARTFNTLLADELEASGIPAVSILEQLLGEDGLARPEYYVDRIHLGPGALPIAIDALGRCGLLPLPG